MISSQTQQNAFPQEGFQDLLLYMPADILHCA